MILKIALFGMGGALVFEMDGALGNVVNVIVLSISIFNFQESQ